MYIIINKTQNKTVYKQGSFPDMYEELEKGDDIIIISLYSNTIKVPYIDHSQNGYGENIWEWKEYKFPQLSNLEKSIPKLVAKPIAKLLGNIEANFQEEHINQMYEDAFDDDGLPF